MLNPKYVHECEECVVPEELRMNLCPYCMAQKVLKGKWKMLIFWHLMQGTKRFNELSRLIPATQTTLTRQLREMEKDGVIDRKVYDVIPPKVEYSLSILGDEFESVTASMREWGLKFFNCNGITKFNKEPIEN